ncbi:Domain of unknown function DUF1863 (plasmid) [Halorubrum lacusprofundi ATCC 49239]|jgi:hypothetical protein|uniref:Thoeris protein ThsB TIR-like domain-containing protein n=1 Tax=Halorubrum lacusprofundi (strain ATCC 49239 / DSM 5036 / JCM 8891 / ACAM 34) TaxID=416348 RepID=B9LWI1_HALLT|nr:TIR domain-containing protein [Halorubrum lacusprofundi]ACM58822.1 Domain of unknown function DUF1863 [Halorubrum lacusprofundi ATCC 49239]
MTVDVNEIEFSAERSGYDLFISHSWKHNSDYDGLIELLDDKNHFSYRNYSVTKKEKVEGKSNRALKRHIKNKQIKPASVVIVIAGMYSTYSDWIGKEVRIAEELDKPIISVKPWGAERTSYITNKADATTGWNKTPIVREVRDLAP